MGSSLRDIPGAGGGRRKRGLGKVGGGAASKPWQPPPKIQNPTRGKRGAPVERRHQHAREAVAGACRVHDLHGQARHATLAVLGRPLDARAPERAHHVHVRQRPA